MDVAAVRSPEFSETTLEVTFSRDFKRPERRHPSQAYLIVIAGGRLGQHVMLGEAPIEIGRGQSCALELDADSVSRQHARVVWDGEAHESVDLDSTNGTYVNEHRIQRARLRDGDRLQLGKVILKYIAADNLESAYFQEMERLVRFDGLTGIANRAAFDQALEESIGRTRAEPAALSLVLLDLDHFKRVNDSLGHAAGDSVLRQLAEIIRAEVPEDVLFARTGGEEFALMLWGSLAQAAALAERIRTKVAAAELHVEGHRVPMTLSLGVAERSPQSEEGAGALYQRTDAQLYAAKSAGRNCVR